MDRTVPDADAAAYREWLRSPSISTTDSDEMVIAWNLAAGLGLHPTRVLRSLRAERGYLAGEMEAVTAAVAADPSLGFRTAGGSRRVEFRDGRRWTRILRRRGGAP
ncbi:MAG TPA: hypothetical protein VHM89_09270 [Acidimicrobiales bacterium]|nr:hypothetical protein [Acidimicrobiales bacterium]